MSLLHFSCPVAFLMLNGLFLLVSIQSKNKILSNKCNWLNNNKFIIDFLYIFQAEIMCGASYVLSCFWWFQFLLNIHSKWTVWSWFFLQLSILENDVHPQFKCVHIISNTESRHALDKMQVDNFLQNGNRFLPCWLGFINRCTLKYHIFLEVGNIDPKELFCKLISGQKTFMITNIIILLLKFHRVSVIVGNHLVEESLYFFMSYK